MRYRICKAFEIESGHMLSKHAERCRYPHGHSRRVEIVLSSESLDANDMVCDFKALKLALSNHLDAYDHAMVLNADDPAAEAIGSVSERCSGTSKPTAKVSGALIRRPRRRS